MLRLLSAVVALVLVSACTSDRVAIQIDHSNQPMLSLRPPTGASLGAESVGSTSTARHTRGTGSCRAAPPRNCGSDGGVRDNRPIGSSSTDVTGSDRGSCSPAATGCDCWLLRTTRQRSPLIQRRGLSTVISRIASSLMP
jgi:hypothetical protein